LNPQAASDGAGPVDISGSLLGNNDSRMNDVLKKLANVRTSVAAIRAEVSGLAATATHLATKNDVSSLESSLIKWIVGTLLTVAVLTFTVARFVKVRG
jgi:hypothetical protein